MLAGHKFAWHWSAIGAMSALLICVPVRAGAPPGSENLPADFGASLRSAICEGECGPIDSSPGRRQFPRLRLFGAPFGCASEIFARTQDDDPTGIGTDAPSDDNDPIFARLDVWVGNDNPYFDFQQRGLLGGNGFYRVNADYFLLDQPESCCVLHCRVVTPAGLAAGGVEHGPTIIRPGMTWSQTLSPGTSAQAFVESKLIGSPKSPTAPEQTLRYGFALQQALPDEIVPDSGDVYLFVQALGRHSSEAPSGAPAVSRWGVVPGIRWEPDETFWLSGGVMFESGRNRSDALLWQITCACRF